MTLLTRREVVPQHCCPIGPELASRCPPAIQMSLTPDQPVPPTSQQSPPMSIPQGNPYAQQPQPNPYAPQGGYPQTNGSAVPGAAYPGGGYAAQMSCRFCGPAPAVDVTFRAHRAMIFLM